QPVMQAKTLIEDALYDLRAYNKEIDSDQFSEIEEKINKLRHLQRKYGKSADNILNAHKEVVNEISQIENAESRMQALAKQKKELELVLLRLGQDLHKKRLKYSSDLAAAVMKELKDLNMKDVQFQVSLQELDRYTTTG